MQKTERDRLNKQIERAMKCGIEPQVIYGQLSDEERWELRKVFQDAGLQVNWQAVVDALPVDYRWEHHDELVSRGYCINLEQLVCDRGGYVAEPNRDPCKIGKGCKKWVVVDGKQSLALSDPDEWSAIEWLLSKGLPKDKLPKILAPMVVVRNYEQLVNIGVEIDLTTIGRRMSPEELQLAWLWLYENGAKVSLAGIKNRISARFLADHLGAALECGYDADEAVNVLSDFRESYMYDSFYSGAQKSCTDTGVVAIIDNIRALLAKTSNRTSVVQQAIRRYRRRYFMGYDRGIDHDDVVNAILASGYDVNEFYRMLPVDDKARLYPKLVQFDATIDLRADALSYVEKIDYFYDGVLDCIVQLYSMCLEKRVTIHAPDWLAPLQKMQEMLSKDPNSVRVEIDEMSRYVKTVLRLCPNVNIYYLVKAIPWSNVVRDNLELLHAYGANPNFLSTRMAPSHVVEKAFQLLSMGADSSVVVKYAGGVTELANEYDYIVLLNYGVDANIVVPCISNIMEELPSLTAIFNIGAAQVVKILLADEPGVAKVVDNAEALVNSGADINDIAQAMSPLQKYTSMPWLLKYDQLDVAFIDNLPPIDALKGGARHDDYLQDSQYRDIDQTWFECLPKLSQRGLASGQLLSKFTAACLISHRQELAEAGYEVSKSAMDDALRRLVSISTRRGAAYQALPWYLLGKDRSARVDVGVLLDIVDAGADPGLATYLLPYKTLTDDQICKLVQAGFEQAKLFRLL